ncbi:Zinc finger protein 805 [Frankliniella fusca]|uniref:Zinc finger protein 805 n=1 Tax=Frankliniella fusca TaxID=407009 RepID=A0AAE1HL76_9NEOP|nr:Zinc finger protein 805 [Frankliniella fusca]
MATKPSVIHWGINKLGLHTDPNTTDDPDTIEKENEDNEDDRCSPPLIVPLSKPLDLGGQESYCFDVKIEVQPLCRKALPSGIQGKGLRITKRKGAKQNKSNNGENRPFKCSTCSKTFVTRQHLARHTNLHSMETLYPCQECDKVCLDRSYLLRHMRTHEAEKPFACTECSKCFRTVNNLKRHSTSHDQSLRQCVCVECGKRFPDNSSLKKHSLCHSGVKTHICTICAKGFSYVGDLNMHMKGHDQVKEYECSDCGRQFSRHTNLVRHRAVHSENGIFQCTVCRVSFQHAATLTRHILSSHPGYVKVRKKTLPSSDNSRKPRAEHMTDTDDESLNNISTETASNTCTQINSNGSEYNELVEQNVQISSSQHIALLPSSQSSFEIYQIDNSGSFLKISDALSVQSLQLLNNEQSPSALYQINTYSGA